MITRTIIVKQWIAILEQIAERLGFDQEPKLESLASYFNSNNYTKYGNAILKLLEIVDRSNARKYSNTVELIGAASILGQIVNARFARGMLLADCRDVDLFWSLFRKLGYGINITTRYSTCLFLNQSKDDRDYLKIVANPTMHGARKLNGKSNCYWGQWVKLSKDHYGQIWGYEEAKQRFVLRAPRGISYYQNLEVAQMRSRRFILRWLRSVKDEVDIEWNDDDDDNSSNAILKGVLIRITERKIDRYKNSDSEDQSFVL